jgi:hypothetical protein
MSANTVFQIEDIVRRVILPYLTHEEANVVSLVSKNFNDDVKDTIFVEEIKITKSIDKFINKFPMSKVLDLSTHKNPVINTDKIYEMTHLRTLIFNHANISDSCIDFSRLKTLTKLDAPCCYGLTDDLLSNLINLVDLNIEECDDLCMESNITGSCFKHMPKLKKLSISNCLKITNQSFDYLSKLEELDVSLFNCFNESQKVLIKDDSIKKLVSIKILNLCGQKHLTNNALSTLNNLEDLTISGCKLITDEGISHLTKLKKLAMGNCKKINGSAFEQINSIEELYANSTELKISNFSYLSKIKRLYIGKCSNINDDIFKYLENSRIQKLEISNNNKIKGTNISKIKGIKSLNIMNCKNVAIENILSLDGLEKIVIHPTYGEDYIWRLQETIKEVMFY